MPTKLPPAPVTVRRTVWVSFSAVAGAVKPARTVVSAVSVPPVPSTRLHTYVTLLPQGSSWPAAAPSTPSITLPPDTASNPPAGPDTACGANPAAPGLPTSVSVASAVSGSNTRAGSAVSALLSRLRVAIPLSPAKSPAFSAAMLALDRSSVPASAARCASVTSEQFVTALLAATSFTRSTSLSRTCPVRPHTPPARLKPGVCDPSAPWSDCAATASWLRGAGAP